MLLGVKKKGRGLSAVFTSMSVSELELVPDNDQILRFFAGFFFGLSSSVGGGVKVAGLGTFILPLGFFFFPLTSMPNFGRGSCSLVMADMILSISGPVLSGLLGACVGGEVNRIFSLLIIFVLLLHVAWKTACEGPVFGPPGLVCTPGELGGGRPR